MHCQLSRDYRFEAAHQLPKVPAGHRCSRVHGHSYLIVVTLAGEVDPELGWLVDFADIDQVVEPIIAGLDHQLLNDIEGLENPTSEVLAAWLWRAIKPALPQLCELQVAETVDSRCIYHGT